MGWISPTCCISTTFLPSISKIYPTFSNIDIKYEHFGENWVNFTNMSSSMTFLPSISKIYPKFFNNIDLKYEHFGENGVNFTNMF
jgi:hypothetical protein